MDKIEVGEYVRTINGIIFEFQKIDEDGYIWGSNYKGCYITDIVKHSENIIDLIENEDCLIYKIRGSDILRKGFVRKHIDLETNREYLSIEFYSLKQIEILGIVTKEQFNSVKYEVD